MSDDERAAHGGDDFPHEMVDVHPESAAGRAVRDYHDAAYRAVALLLNAANGGRMRGFLYDAFGGAAGLGQFAIDALRARPAAVGCGLLALACVPLALWLYGPGPALLLVVALACGGAFANAWAAVVMGAVPAAVVTLTGNVFRGKHGLGWGRCVGCYVKGLSRDAPMPDAVPERADAEPGA